jgi:pyruvate formate lyase activating enzyme
MGLVFDIKRFAVHDGPGIRTTVFFKGCSLGCWWCHNPEGQSSAPEMIFRAGRCIGCGACQAICGQHAVHVNGALAHTDRDKCVLCGECVEVCYAGAREIAGREMSVAEVMAEVRRDLAFYEESGGGVTFSGGEPLLRSDFLLPLLCACREQGIHTALDTCGHSSWEALDSVRQHVDLFLYDLKVMDNARHRRYTGVSNESILRNLQMLSEQGHRIRLRLPVIPGINDDDENVRAVGAFAAALPHLEQVDILPYHRAAVDKYARLDRAYRLPETRSPSGERMSEIAGTLQAHGLKVRVGG